MIDLADNWVVSGTEFKEFANVVKELDSATRIYKFAKKDISLLSLNEEGTIKEGHVPMLGYKDKPEEPLCRSGYPIVAAKKHGHSEKVIAEFLNDSKTLITLNRKHYLYVSREVFRDLGARCNLAGDAIYEASPLRDAYLTELLHQSEKIVTLVVRTDGVSPKLFAVPSETYVPIPQYTLVEAVNTLEEELGKVNCCGWEINHRLTRLYIEFPEKAEDIAKVYGRDDLPIPGMMLETSDTGDSGVIFTTTWRVKSNPVVYGESYAKKHTGKLTVSTIMDGVKNTLFASYTQLPERLCELSLVEVGNPRAVISKVVDQALGKALGKRRAKSLAQELCDEIPEGTIMTGFDIAMIFIDGLITRTVFSDTGKLVLEGFQKALYQVPFCPIEKWAKGTEPKIELLPA